MLDHFFVLSARGDTIITRDFRGEAYKGTSELFFRKVKFWKGDPPPTFNHEGINFLHTKKNSLYFVFTTKTNVSASYVFELLNRLLKIFKDYTGVLTEEAIRKNFVLIYELVDEVIDFGYPQLTTTELIKPMVVNDPVMVESPSLANSFKTSVFSSKTISSNAAKKSVHSKGKQKNEIFVDIYERLSVLFNASGYIVNANIEGAIQMKSYLSGNPELRLILNDDLVIGRHNMAGGGFGTPAVLDDCVFHECVRLTDFEANKTITIMPPDGEFTVMNYRINTDYETPFRIFPFLDVVNNYQLELVLKVRASFQKKFSANNVVIRFPVPKNTSKCSFTFNSKVAGQKGEHKTDSGLFEWVVPKFIGGAEYGIRVKISISEGEISKAKKEVGPIRMNFEIPMFNVSNLQVKNLRISEKSKGYNPFKWVRYVTQASSYECRISS
eukprot:CAMPEP_0115012300 /NCGR_PEP_ID=MMETSP0216-20121206/24638_1 /TAXON_ID=223996 /ORGANISM="Protocruzia adherens, Strain Boccale" /LENGTH=439 /DNA_ID=CAMNT_0002381297 /DNA_START=30 /DNA_END=1349 /DNA_ORIENTATION=+